MFELNFRHATTLKLLEEFTVHLDYTKLKGLISIISEEDTQFKKRTNENKD